MYFLLPSERRVARVLRGQTLIVAAIFSSLSAYTPGASSASPVIGTLTNFDVVNDTGGPTHGFDIELEGVHREDISFTFGGPHSRYGDPEVIDVSGATPKTVVRYRRWDGSAWVSTPVAAEAVRPRGHDCFQNGPIGNYATSGCEHFGLSTAVEPTQVVYRWLVAANPGDFNSLFEPVPLIASLPVPAWRVQPPRIGGGGGVGVRAEVKPPEEEREGQYGEPQWVKVFKVTSEEKLEPEDLVRLLLGAPDSVVPGETEIETEWKLIQSKPGLAEGDEEDADVREDVLPGGRRSVIRRYEFYRYNGPRDPENNEALPCVADDQAVPANAPVNGCSDLGDFIGAQNVAIDVGLSALDEPLPEGVQGADYGPIEVFYGGSPPYEIRILSGALPLGVSLETTSGVLSGKPEIAGEFEFTLEATDSVRERLAARFRLSVRGEVLPTPTPSPTVVVEPTASPTPTEGSPRCVGDCGGDGAVTVDEIVTLVNIALGLSGATSCPLGIPEDTEVDITIIVRAVASALNGCPT